jgi:hypothetical protein
VDSRPSLQVRGGNASTARTAIHIAEKLNFFRHGGLEPILTHAARFDYDSLKENTAGMLFDLSVRL